MAPRWCGGDKITENNGLVRGDAETPPLRDTTFEAVLSAGSIEFWPSPVQALREMWRVLRPRRIALVGGLTMPKDRPHGLLTNNMMLFYDGDEARNMFRHAGFLKVMAAYTGPRWKPDLAMVTRE